MIEQAVIALLQAEKYDEVITRLLPLSDGKDVDMLVPLGLAYIGAQRWHDAVILYKKLTDLQPDVSSYWLNLGTALQNDMAPDQAIIAFERTIKLEPQNVTALGNLAYLYWQKRAINQVRHYAEQAAALDPDNPDIMNLQALGLAADKQFSAAQLLWERALSLPLRTASTAMLLANRANAMVDERRFARAEATYQQAMQLGGLSHEIWRNYAMLLLQMGRWRDGWAMHEARILLPGTLPKSAVQIWQGEDVTDKHVLVTSEQGLGDTLQFMRFVPMLVARACKVTLAIRKPLVDLVRQQRWCDVIDIAEVANCRADMLVPIMSLPLRLQAMEPESWPTAPYVKAAPSNQLPNRGRRKIGVVWAGSAGNKSDAVRSISLPALEPLWQVDADFYPVFLHDTLDQITTQPLHRIDNLLQGFAATAAILKELDLLITVDTSLCHLAGALGVPTILLLNYSGEWRWTTDEENQPLYDRKNFTVLRQPHIGDWDSVIAELVEKLR